ncbi:hypothetical protein [Gulosibacter sp. 10]|uniref:hypothetical protein n=1 Tax=Gulosibacter sp. 10 TaxID=1255570 RepID=UPI00097EBC85|nr:hypothetical protein [Gulosibacter sp. 10]SJM71728.1 hypothetical protein FM112_16740 [Gulosibacter sp. 10]
MNTEAKAEPAYPLVERILAYLATGIAILAFIGLLTVLLAPLFGVDYATSHLWVWNASMFVAYWGFPVALILVVALLLIRVISNRRAGREQ